ncbi:MAG: hypothetical protein IJ498_07265 [Akkermansia sp.]|nr:hypothetical protein [Akkermansia sp.]
MKLHLNLSLRRALMAAMAAVCTLSSTSFAGVMHSDVTTQTYTDFGQNRGRYVVDSGVNALLNHIRAKVDKGIVINYTDGTSFTISEEQGMINFSGTHDAGHSAVISSGFVATVLHNGSLNGSFSERTVGSAHAINYDAIDIRGSNVFRLAPDNGVGGQYDYMVQRQSKIVTDVSWNPLTTLTNSQIENLDGSYLYHSGSGTQYRWNEEKDRMEGLTGAYAYIIGAINNIQNGQIHAQGSNLSLHQNPNYGDGVGASDVNPLPNGIRPGDSGSPTYIYNEGSGQYEYIAAQQSAGGYSYGQARGDVTWTQQILKSFDSAVDMSGDSVVYLGAITHEGEYKVDQYGNSTQIYYGLATDADGNELARYNGIRSGANTWADLSSLKDTQNWYAYGSSYLQQKDTDLFFNNNLVFTPSQADNTIILTDTVDLGSGYVEFNSGKLDKATYTIQSVEGKSALLNSAGLVINEGAEVHLKLNNPSTHMYEWRKNGAGDLYIDGTGDSNALLTVGGSGTTYLTQTDGYAAYNVLVSSGARVQIKDTSQIARDFTFGAGGGVLDMNGNEMEWYMSNTDVAAKGFSINALTEGATIVNSSATAAKLTFKESGNRTFAGSFVSETISGADSKATLNIVYDGGGIWTLNSIRTSLSSSSSFVVNSGTVVLSGVNTVHGTGSASGTNANRLVNVNDWHYADATMDVEVVSGARFELGSHARLTGMVYVNNGGTFVLREGVKHRYEYVEGGARLEDTYLYADFYGLHKEDGYGVYLGGADAAMKVEYSAGTTANTTIAASLYGKGSLTVDAGTAGGSLTLSGDNSGLSGKKTLLSGGLIATSNAALGNVSSNKWVVGENAWIASRGFEDGAKIGDYIDSSSTGTFALSNDIEQQLDFSSHSGMVLGAEVGKVVQYGKQGTDEVLTPLGGVWTLGGGGGELVVNFKLSGDNDLILGKNGFATGTVTLTNTGNDFNGDIIFNSVGIVLNATQDTLGNGKVALSYGNVLGLSSVSDSSILRDDSKGIVALSQSMDIDLSSKSVALGVIGDVVYSGNLQMGDTIRLGGNGNLTLANKLSGAANMVLDGQGNTGSSITFARSQAFDGNIVAGGGLQLSEPNSAGDIAIHVGHTESLASASSIQLNKGATLYTDGKNLTIQNLSIGSGGALVNGTGIDSDVTLRVTDGATATIESNTLSGKDIHLNKTGDGKLVFKSTSGDTWWGGLTVSEGTVEADIHSSGWTNFGGVGSSSNVVTVKADATLKLNAETRYGFDLMGTALPQTVVGDGTIEMASGGAVVFANQSSIFDGTIKISGGTRFYVGDSLQMNGSKITWDSLSAIENATVEVERGSQVRITSSLQYLTDSRVSTHADFIIDGQSYTGGDSSQGNALLQADLDGGALSIDAASTVYGNITLAGDAAIASWSAGLLVNETYIPEAVIHMGRPCTDGTYSSYRLKGHLGGTVRGRILGEGKNLTLLGNETLTFTADSANTYANLIINIDGNGHEDDKVALKLDAGAARNQVSTALGKGNVTLNDGLILRLAGTGTADMADVEYTYANNMSVGKNATLQSHNITNKLTGKVSMSGDSLNFATANGGVLNLAGGLQGSGSLNVDAASVIILGSSSSGSAQFCGDIVTGAGVDMTLGSSSVVSSTSTFSGVDSLTLRLLGTEDYTLGGIELSGSDTTSLTIHFDFTDTPLAGDDSTWSTLTVTNGILAASTLVDIDVNIFNDIEKGSYTLINKFGSGSYDLVNNLNGRLTLTTVEGALVLVVDADGRLCWRSNGESSSWNSVDANWYQESSGSELVTFSAQDDVVFDENGVADGNGADSREQVVVSDAVTVGKVEVKDSTYYEISGEGTISVDSLVVSNKADAVLNLSSETASQVSEGVTVSDASLEIRNTALTASATATNGGALSLTDGTAMTGNALAESGASVSMNAATLVGNLTVTEASATISNNSRINGNAVVHEGSLEISDSTLSGTLTGTGIGSATLSNATITGDLLFSEVNNTLSLASAASGELKWDVTADTLTAKALSTNGTVVKKGKGELVILGSSSTGRYEGKLGTTSIGQDAQNTAFLTVSSVEFADNDKVGAVTVNVNEGSTFKITGTGVQGNYANSGFLMGEWNSAATLNVAGTVMAANSSLHVGDTTSYVNIDATGTLAVKGIRNGNTSKSSGIVLSMDAGGRMVIGSEGVATNSVFTATLNGGTIASSSATTSLNGNFHLNVAVEVDTNRYAFAADGNSISRGSDTSVISINGTLGGDGNLSLSGNGKVLLNAADNGFQGRISLDDSATLAITETSRGVLDGAAGVAVNAGTLDLSALSFGTDTGKIVMSNESVYSFTSDSTVAFGAMEEETWYTIFDTSAYGATVSGWEELSLGNFSINGMSMSDMGRVNLALVANSGLFYYEINSLDLVWNAGTDGVWNRDAANANWQVYDDETSSWKSSEFANFDNVSFLSDASVTLGEDVSVGSIAIADNTTVTLTETGALTAESITVGKDAMLTFATEKTGYTAANISGEGKVVLYLTDNWNNALKLGSSFTGETYVTSGYIDLTNAAVGKTLRLANGVNANSATGVTTVTADIILEGTSIVHANKEKAITYVGTVTGENGVFESNGGSSHTFNAEVNLAGFKTSHSGNTNTFNAKTTLATATISQAAVNFNGETALGTAAISGGTTTFNASADVTAATFSGGTTNFNGSTALTTANFSGGTVNFATDSLEIGTFNRGSGNINFKLADGATKTNYTIGNISGDNYGNLTVDSGVTLNAGTITTPVAFAGSSRNLTVNGEMNLSGGMNMRYSKDVVLNGTGTLNVAEGVNLQLTQWGAANISVNKLNIGGNLSLNSYWQANSVHHVNILSGETTVEGQVQHASTGYNNGSDRVTLNINGGSLIMKGGATMSQGTTTLSAGKLEQAGGTSTISNTFSMSGGELAVSGGTMTIESTPTVTGGDVAISGGTLSFGTAEAASALLAGADNINLSGGELDLSVGNFTESSGGLSLGAVMAVSGSGTIKLGDSLTTDTTYDIFTIGDGASLDWENMGDHLMVNGTAVSRYSGASLAVTDAGVATLSFSGLDKSSVYWVGGESGAWNYSSSSWDLGAADADASNNVSFLINDTVVFASDASVTVTDGVTVGGLTIEAGKHLTTTGGIEMADSAVITTGDGSKWTLADGTEQTLSKSQVSDVTALEIAKGATLTVSDSAMAGYSATNLSGEGTVELNLSATYGNTVNVGSSFKGETYVTGGHFSVTSAVVGETLRLAHGVNMQSDKTATVAANLILEGETTVHANSSKPITYSGSVTGDNGVYISQASSSHTFNGTVDLKEVQTAAGAAVNFNGSTTLDKATISRATVTFAGKTDITEAAISGGTTNFDSTTTLASLTQTGGTINANGTMEVTGKVTGTGGTLVLKSGELKLSYTGEDGNSISLLDGSKGGTAAGTLRVAKDASVTVAGQIWGRKASSIVLEQGAELVNTADEVKFSNRGTAEANFRTASTVNDAEYSTNSTDWELINGHLASTASGDKMLTNKLVNSSVENAGSGKLTVSNSGNSITDVYATAGSIDIEQLSAAVNLNLSELTVADSKTVSLYSGSGDSRVEANVTVTSHAKFGTGAVLNANLTLQSGSTLGVAEGGLAMGSTLTLQKGLTLDDTTLGRVHALSAGESTALFTGVDGLTLDKTPYTSLTEADSILANPYFTNLNSSNQYVLTYSGTDNGTLSIMAASVPEPTTTTLSLLALSALAMRRRRK